VRSIIFIVPYHIGYVQEGVEIEGFGEGREEGGV
jgi:hypothetical protein